MHEDQVTNVIALDHQDRLEYTIREIVKHEAVWMAFTETGFPTLVSNDEEEILPIWPSKEVAELCLPDQFKEMNATIDFIDIDTLMDELIPDMTTDQVWFGMFYNDKTEGLIITGESLTNHLNEELGEEDEEED